MMLHEITHNLGAVQPSAPHSTPNGHCWDGNDVMCYADGSTGSQPYTPSACPSIPGTITDVYDCGHDDYYDPAAAPGSYLDTHWNVYRSVFMSACTILGDACGGLARTLAPPVPGAAPEVQGTPQAGEVLVGTVGSWANAPTSYRVRWQQERVRAGPLVRRARRRGVRGRPRGRRHAPAHRRDGRQRRRQRPRHVRPDARRHRRRRCSIPARACAPLIRRPAPTAAVPAARTSTTPAVAPLRIVLRGGGRLAARLTARVAPVTGGVAVTSAAVRARAARGRWRLKLCAAAPGQPRRCALGPRTPSAHGSVRLAAVRVLLRTTSKRITVTAALVDSSTRRRRARHRQHRLGGRRPRKLRKERAASGPRTTARAAAPIYR